MTILTMTNFKHDDSGTEKNGKIAILKMEHLETISFENQKGKKGKYEKESSEK